MFPDGAYVAFAGDAHTANRAMKVWTITVACFMRFLATGRAPLGYANVRAHA
jgi:hypothetical protein